MSTSAERKQSTIALISFDVRGFLRIAAVKILRALFATSGACSGDLELQCHVAENNLLCSGSRLEVCHQPSKFHMK